MTRAAHRTCIAHGLLYVRSETFYAYEGGQCLFMHYDLGSRIVYLECR